MAPAHKKSGTDPASKRGRRILGFFGFGSKMIKKDAAAKPDEKVLQKWGDSNFKVVSVDDHALAKLLLINHESQQKKDGTTKLIKQHDDQAKDSCFGAKLSKFERSKSNQMYEPSDIATKLQVHREDPDLKKSCRKTKKGGRSSKRMIKGDAIAAMSLLMVILIIMLLCGRLCAIVCASIWFYCMPHFINTTKSNNSNKNSNKENDSTDAKHESSEFDSKEYRRKVVLHGILARKNKIDFGIS